jgi:hypothetical protein
MTKITDNKENVINPDPSALNAAVVIPSDTVNLDFPTRFLWVGGAGNVSVEMEGSGSAIVLEGITAGTMLPIRVKRVNVTGTTATKIVALW